MRVVLIAVLAACSRPLPRFVNEIRPLAVAAVPALAPGEAVTLEVSGGTPPYTAAVVGSGRAEGVVYTADVQGNTIDEITVTDAAESSVRTRVQVGAPLVLSPTEVTLAPGANRRFEARGGKPPYVFTASADVMQGETLTAGPDGNRSLQVTVTDAVQQSRQAQVRISAALELIALTSLETVPRGSVRFVAVGGEGPYTFRVEDAQSGAASVDATGAYQAGSQGSVTDVVEVEDAWQQRRQLSVTVGAGLALGTLAKLRPGVPTFVDVTGGRAPYSLAFAPDGNFSGGRILSDGRTYVPGLSPHAVDKLVMRDADGASLAFDAEVSSFSGQSVGFLGCEAADLNGDGRAELVFSRLDRGSAPDPEVESWSLDSDNTWQRLLQRVAPEPLSDVAIHDVNGDGAPDMVVSTRRTLAYFVNDYAGHLTQRFGMPAQEAIHPRAPVGFVVGASGPTVWRLAGNTGCAAGVGFAQSTYWPTLSAIPSSVTQCSTGGTPVLISPPHALVSGAFQSANDSVWLSTNGISVSVNRGNIYTAEFGGGLYPNYVYALPPHAANRNMISKNGTRPLVLVRNGSTVSDLFSATVSGGTLASFERLSLPVETNGFELYRATATGPVHAFAMPGGQHITFSPLALAVGPAPFSRAPTCVASGDVNGDGVNDLVVTSANDSEFEVLTGDGDYGFNRWPHRQVGVASTTFAADFDGDGATELLAKTVDGFLQRLEQVAQGLVDRDRTVFPAPRLLAQANGVIWGQSASGEISEVRVTNDRVTLVPADIPVLPPFDQLVPAPSGRLAFGQAAGNRFVIQTSLGITSIPAVTIDKPNFGGPGFTTLNATNCAFAYADLDGDMADDAVAACSEAFWPPSGNWVTAHAGGVYVNRITLPLALAGWGEHGGFFYDPTAPPANMQVRAIGARDGRAHFLYSADGDGTMLVTATANGPMASLVLSGRMRATASVLFDANADAYADVAVSYPDQRHEVFLQSADGSFAPAGPPFYAPGVVHAALGHDLVLRGTRDISIARNQGDGTFTP